MGKVHMIVIVQLQNCGNGYGYGVEKAEMYELDRWSFEHCCYVYGRIPYRTNSAPL